MTDPSDPFHDLRAPVVPVDPDPAFARRLRTRLERALTAPRGVVPVTATVDNPPAPSAPPGPRPAAVPYLAVAGGRAAVDWYVDVFGATVVGEPYLMPDGRIGHIELEISGGVIYLADEAPDLGVVAPRPGEAAVSLMLPVDDADRVRGRAVDRGANGDRPPYDGYGQRQAWIVDPFGHRWGLTSPLVDRSAPVAYRHGDVMHVAHVVPDIERARDFYRAVLGWSYLPDGRVDGSAPSVGFRQGPAERAGTLCDYAVTDLERTLAAVADGGGTPGEIERYDWGTVAECVDDQGTEFRVHLVDTTDGPQPPVNGNGPGDLGYLTLQVADSARARAFYGAVLGWAFTPGRIDDGWAVDGPAPMTGLAGGHDRGTAVPQWLVGDIDVAVAAVRANGGTATEPRREPYGMSADCVDDQGLRFYLGQA